MKHKYIGRATGDSQPTNASGALKDGFYCTDAEALDAPEAIANGSHRRREEWSDDGLSAEVSIGTTINIRGYW